MATERFGPCTFESANRDRILFPGSGVTKGDLMDYYRRAAPVMLPYVRGRPVTMQRFPSGIGKEGFYQKGAPEHFPDWVDRVRVPLRSGGSQAQVLVEKAASLVYLAEQGCVTPHVWLSRADSLEYPDRVVFDLDPPDGDFSTVRNAALRMGVLLEELGLAPFAMTTGSRGVHVVSPLDRSAAFEAVRDFARGVAEVLGGRYPEKVTVQVSRKKRKGRLFIDTMRNAYGQTAVAPYAVRPLEGAPVAAPVTWEELERTDLTPRTCTIETVLDRLEKQGDPWAGMGRRSRSLDEPLTVLRSFKEKTGI